MQMFVAHTEEIDDAKSAVDDILRALPSDVLIHAKAGHAVGILATHADALSSGAVEAICNALPFDVVGMTCFASCGDGEVDLDLLTLVVFVGESVTFATAMTEVLYEENQDPEYYKKAIAAAYDDIKAKLGGQGTPALTFAYMPFISELSGQKIIDSISEVTGGSPIFGGLASDHTAYGDSTYVIHNGQQAKGRLALVCMAGPVKASFMYASLCPDNIKEAIITSASGTQVHSVNDIPMATYIESLGLSPNDWQQAGIIVSFLTDFKDGSPLAARELLHFTADGSAHFGGTMPLGAPLYLGLQSAEGILQSAEDVLRCIEQRQDTLLGAFVICCVGRSLLLGANPLIEAEKALEILQNNIPYAQFYTRGEVCPATLADGQLQNRYHNFSFTVCMFERI